MLIPTLILMFLVSTKKDKFSQYFSKDILSKLSIKNKYMNKTTRNILFFISIILMTLSLARPVVDEKEHSFKQEVSAIVIAVDVSKSMLATDIYPNRLALAKRKLLDIIENSKQNALAVILFAKSSFILSPITQDFNSLKILVENFDTGINFDNGSNIFSSLESTVKLLKDYENKNLLILSDGGNNKDFKEEIKFAKENKINVYTIALASNKAAPIKIEKDKFLTKSDGSIVTVALNEKIKDLSLNTNGGYINYSLNDGDIKQILLDIEKKSIKKQLESKKFKSYTELFYYPLGLAIFTLFIAFSSLPRFISKRFALFFILIFTSFYTNKLYAFDFEIIKEAKAYYKKGEYKKSAKEFEKVAKTPEAKYDYANSLYKAKQYKKALKTYKDVTTSDENLEYKKLHNMGNSYVKLNDLENAKKMYENALKIKADKQTRENLETIQDILNKRKKQKKQNQQKNKKNQNKKKDKQNQQNKKDKSKNSEKNKQKDKKQENKNKKEQNKVQQSKNDKQKKKKEKTQKKASQKIKKQEISDLEEKKWLKKLENRKNQILLKKLKTKNNDNSSNPW